MNELNFEQLRRVADFLYDGEPKVAHLMSQIRQYKDGDRVLLWLVRNNIRGKKMIEFFKDEASNDDSTGVLRGVQTALSFIDNRGVVKQKMTLGNLK